MTRKAHIIGHATDYEGLRWDVRERRPTRHGFDVLIGWPESAQRGQGGRGPGAILTAELSRYLQATRPRDVDLPIGKTTVDRLRALIGLKWSWDEWWDARAADLASMSLSQFCQRHGCSIGATSQRRALLLATRPT